MILDSSRPTGHISIPTAHHSSLESHPSTILKEAPSKECCCEIRRNKRQTTPRERPQQMMIKLWTKEELAARYTTTRQLRKDIQRLHKFIETHRSKQTLQARHVLPLLCEIWRDCTIDPESSCTSSLTTSTIDDLSDDDENTVDGDSSDCSSTTTASTTSTSNSSSSNISVTSRLTDRSMAHEEFFFGRINRRQSRTFHLSHYDCMGVLE